MKVLGVFLFILLLSISLSVCMDILLDYTLSESLLHLFNPFWVVESGEYVMLVFLVLLTIGHQIVLIMKNKESK